MKNVSQQDIKTRQYNQYVADRHVLVQSQMFQLTKDY